jgi:hypothetical protein
MAGRYRKLAAAAVLALALTPAGCSTTVSGTGSATGVVPTGIGGDFPSAPAPTGTDGTGTDSQVLAKFVGTWTGHGRTLTITADGTGLIVFRAYKNCSDDPTPPCDIITGNQIKSGGKLTFRIVQVISDNGNYGAEVRILSTNDPQIDTSEPGGLALDKRDVITAEFVYESTFSGPRAPAVCGA